MAISLPCPVRRTVSERGERGSEAWYRQRVQRPTASLQSPFAVGEFTALLCFRMEASPSPVQRGRDCAARHVQAVGWVAVCGVQWPANRMSQPPFL